LQSVFPQWAQDVNTAVSFVGSLLTAAGFALTIYVTYQIRQIRRHYLARGRLPDVVKELETMGSILNTQLVNWPTQEHAFHGQVQLTVQLMKTAIKMLKRADGVEAREIARKLVRKKSNTTTSRDDAWKMYFDVQTVVMALSQVVKNMDWE